jgi:hypothetical protein
MARGYRLRTALAIGIACFGAAASASAHVSLYRIQRNPAVVERDRRQELRRKEERRQRELEKKLAAEKAASGSADPPAPEPPAGGANPR